MSSYTVKEVRKLIGISYCDALQDSDGWARGRNCPDCFRYRLLAGPAAGRHVDLQHSRHAVSCLSRFRRWVGWRLSMACSCASRSSVNFSRSRLAYKRCDETVVRAKAECLLLAQSGHSNRNAKCPLMTQSGHRPRLKTAKIPTPRDSLRDRGRFRFARKAP
jgi:hypothetical protein